MSLRGMKMAVGFGAFLLAALAMLQPETAQGREKKKKPAGNENKQPAGNNQPAGQDEPDGTKADVMFVLDITGSMDYAIVGVEKGLEKILNRMKKNGIDARVGLTVFRDKKLGNKDEFHATDGPAGIKGDPFTFTFEGDSAFTSNQKEYRAVISKIKAGGGGDLPENSLEAIKHASEAKTRKAVSRIMVLITDDEPHPGATLDARLKDTRDALTEHRHHHLYLVCKPIHRPIYQKIYSEQKGHKVDGAFFPINNASAAFAGILEKVSEQAVKDVIARRKKAAAKADPKKKK